MAKQPKACNTCEENNNGWCKLLQTNNPEVKLGCPKLKVDGGLGFTAKSVPDDSDFKW